MPFGSPGWRLEDLLRPAGPHPPHRPEHLRSGLFDAYFEDRREALVGLVAGAMGRPVARTTEAPGAEDPQDFDENRVYEVG